MHACRSQKQGKQCPHLLFHGSIHRLGFLSTEMDIMLHPSMPGTSMTRRREMLLSMCISSNTAALHHPIMRKEPVKIGTCPCEHHLHLHRRFMMPSSMVLVLMDCALKDLSVRTWVYIQYTRNLPNVSAWYGAAHYILCRNNPFLPSVFIPLAGHSHDTFRALLLGKHFFVLMFL